MTAAKRLRAALMATPAPKRVACYCRKSTTKGLDSSFNSLDNQREFIENYIRSKADQGWVAVEDSYDDGGYSGGSTDRPALQRLLTDMRAGQVDVIAVYRLDRISRSIADFAVMIGELKDRGIEFVSVTECFDTATPMGRMGMNVLATFSQFEREVISERTKDKMTAARKRGIFCGGTPPYGFRVEDKRLIPDPELADRLREIFALYLMVRSLRAVTDEINGRGWRTRRGRPWTTSTVSAILKNPTYVGQTRIGDEIVDGEHEALVEDEVFRAVQARLAGNGHKGGAAAKNKHIVLLRGLIHCGSCGKEMKHSFTSKVHRRHHYYRCPSRNADGTRCVGASIPLSEIESLVIREVSSIGQDPKLLTAIVEAAHAEADRQRPTLRTELAQVQREQTALMRKRQRLVDAIADAGVARPAIRDEIGAVEEQAASLSERADHLEHDLQGLDANILNTESAARSLRDFDGVWKHLSQPERERLLRLVLREVVWHGADGEAELLFREGLGR